MAFPHYLQADVMDCGPTCLRIVSKYYGRSISAQYIRDKCFINKSGVSLLSISQTAELIGYQTQGTKLSFNDLSSNVTLPCIIHWQSNHFVVLYKITQSKVYVSDPGSMLLEYSVKEFIQNWGTYNGENEYVGIALLLVPNEEFYANTEANKSGISFTKLFKYLFSYKALITQLLLGLVASTGLQLIFPFLTQAIVDIGINTQNLDFIYIILGAQFMLFFGRLSIEFIRSWILLHISTRISIYILTTFIIKLLKLPLFFFDTKHFGDIMQRLNDHKRIQLFLTNTTLNVIFSFFTLITFGVTLLYYESKIFLMFIIGSSLYSLWITLFLKKRKIIDYKRFALNARDQSNIVGLITGMQEIKLANAELPKRWEWEHIQAKLFKTNIKQLSLEQYQQVGAQLINESKNILITFLSARSVLDGDMTLGAMLAVQYIVGQLNSPVEQLIVFLQSFQDAKISLERLAEVEAMQNEDSVTDLQATYLPHDKLITIQNLSFRYNGNDENVITNINMKIPQGKTTAIVGMSGSGKTTLLKLLLKFYTSSSGTIKVGQKDLNDINHKIWRSVCGVVMQDGFIFSDTIVNNITIGTDKIDYDKLAHACKVANIQEFIEHLPLGYNTKIGSEGNGISQGQKQRLLIARAVYKDPEYIFFDEATNSLDANNEGIIMHNLEDFFCNRTVIVVAHRLSTVQRADQIIVLDKGHIVEQGTHEQLICNGKSYYNLVKNQLQLNV